MRDISQKTLRLRMKKQITILESKALYKILSSLAYIIAIEELISDSLTKSVIFLGNLPDLAKPSSGS